MPYRQTRPLPPSIPPDVQSDWGFELEESVILTMTGETGFVVARKESLFDQDQYEVLYVNASGSLTRQWWPEGALEQINLHS